MAKGRKQPSPRGYDPGGFRFPGRTPFVEHPGRYDDERREQAPRLVGAADLAGLSALATVAVAAVRRRRG